MTAENYRYADGKPDATLVNYNTVRPPELKLVYNTLDESPIDMMEVKKLRKKFADENFDHLDQCIQFLHAVDFVERPEDRVIELINEDVFPDLPFEAKLLHHLRRQERPQDHLSRAQDIAFEKAPRSLERDLLVTYLKRDLDYINWNKTKVNMWYRMYEGIGVLTYIDSRELILSPSRALLYDLLEEFSQSEGSNDFGEAVAWIEEYFMTVLDSRPGTPQLHQGVTDTLQNLIDDEIIEIRGMADAQNEVKIPSTHSRTEEPRIKEFHLLDELSRNRASYQYPLNKFTEVVQ